MKPTAQKEKITKLIQDEFHSLSDNHDFGFPVVVNGRWGTQIEFLSADIEIEIEIDWRESQAHVLIVRLEGGRLPKGYYVSNGRVCRKHLVNIARELGWDTSIIQLPPKEDSLEKKLLYSLQAQKALLFAHLDDVKRAGQDLFPIST